MDGIHPQRLQMVDGPRLCQCEELTWILCILAGDGEIAMVHLVDDEICRRLHHWALITAPVLGIGLGHVDDGATLAIYTYSLSEHTRALAITDVEGIKLAHQVALYRSSPEFVASARHLDGLLRLAS